MGKDFKPKLLQRQRISHLLEGILAVPLFILLSSMGYGKTTAVKQFLGSKKGVSYAWLALSTGEIDEAWLWQRFCRSLAGINLELSRQLSGYGFPKMNLDFKRVFDAIENELTRPTVIVIDDYQENKSTQWDKLINALVWADLPNLHIVLISRSLPEIPFEELVLKGRCIKLSQDKFEFDRSETSELFALNGFHLSPEEQVRLYENTEGWTAAIYLALLKYAEDKTVGDIRDVTRLMKTSVYDKFPAQTREVLLKISLLDSFSLDAAVFITGDKNAGRLITDIAANNCFIRHDHQNGTYSIHAILKTMLHGLLAESDIDETALLACCGDWCMRCGMHIEAIDFYHRSGKFEKILDIFELPAATELLAQAPQIIVSAFDSMDMKLKLSRPLAYLTYIYAFLGVVDAVQGAGMLYEAKAVYEADQNLIEREHILGEIALAESILQFNHAILMNEYQKKAFSLFGGGSSRISNPEEIFTFGSPHTLYLYHREPGKLLGLVENIEANVDYYTHVSNGLGTGFECIARAELCLETGDLEKAEIFARKAIFKASTKQQLSIAVCGYLCLARHRLLTGRPQEALAFIDDLRAEVEGSGHPLLLNSADIAEGYINGCLGNIEQIPEWLREGDLSGCSLFVQGMGINYFVIGQAAILRGDFPELEILAETMKEIYTPHCHIFGFIYAGIYDAIAKKHLYGPQTAQEALLTAIELAGEDSIVAPFAENIPELGPLLQDMKERLNPEWAGQVFALAELFTKSLEIVRNQQPSLSLTERETEVLRLLEEGCTQKEIAARLYLSPNTVRRHLQNVYAKLGVNNKTLAIKKAREN